MKTPEEIKRGLQYCATPVHALKGCAVCPYWDYMLGCGEDCMMKDALTYIQQLEQCIPQWNSVEENPPREGECVSCYFPHKQYGSKIMVDYNQAGEGATPHFSNQALWGRCTHWMPLPSTEGLHDD